jgi:hypothetical protein
LPEIAEDLAAGMSLVGRMLRHPPPVNAEH